jgi:hypothetical protein
MRHVTTLLIALLRAASISWLTISPFAWIMRDGMGPDSVTSEGLMAAQRTFTVFNYGPIALALLLANLLVQRRFGGLDKSSTPYAMIGLFSAIILVAAGFIFFS